MSSQWQSLADMADSVQTGRVKAADLVAQALKTIEQKKEFNAVISLTAERAGLRAQEIDQRIKDGEKIGPLAGIPFIAKDNFLTYGGETTAASNILKGFNAPYQATAINKLEAAGAIVVAKANLDAFAHGGSTENSDFMVTKNPHDDSRVPGGSSGGSAAAVVLDMVPFALGTDTGGSIRQPASFSGAVGLKPTYGLVSRSGVVAMASSTDVIGPLARTVADAALVLDVMAGKDPLDATSIDSNTAGYTINKPASKKISGKIGVVKEYMDSIVDDGVKRHIEQVIHTLEQNGAHIEAVSLPSLPLALACYYIICPAEVSSNLSRYDGQRYGYTQPNAQNIEESYIWSRSEGFGKEAKRRIMLGTYVLSSGYYDAYYKKAQQLRTKIIREFEMSFQNVDFLLGPVTPTTAFKIGQKAADPLEMYLQDTMTVAINLAGAPAMSVPAGKSNGLPVGLQLIAPMRADRELLLMAHDIEELLLP